jgi:hypothetical protein
MITAGLNGQEVFTVESFLYSTGNIGFGSHSSESHFDNLNGCGVE